jgi:TusE/DsrC/DsvC family sulfur relay protein
VMAVVRDAAESFDSSNDLKPVGLLGAYRKIKKDKNVQRGFALVLDVLSRMGRASARAPRTSRTELRAVSNYSAPPTRSPTAHSRPAASTTSAPTPSSSTGAGPSDESRFIEDAEWSRELAAQTAKAYGVVEMTEDHWQLIDFVRAQYVSSGSTPNIRKITKLSGIPTRNIYALFPKAPGKVMAATAGVPKPVGCL